MDPFPLEFLIVPIFLKKANNNIIHLLPQYPSIPLQTALLDSTFYDLNELGFACLVYILSRVNCDPSVPIKHPPDVANL